ncbi:MAG TPA: hypothetical protein VGF01_11440 [Terracidiphilus sp.]
MTAHCFAGFGFNSAIQILGQIRKQFAALCRTLLIMSQDILGLFLYSIAATHLSRRNFQQLIHFSAYREARAMQPDPNGSRLKVKYLRNLSGRQFLHVAKYKNNAQLRRDMQDRLVQKMILLGMKQMIFRTLACILQQPSQLCCIGHQLIQREGLTGRMCWLFAHAPAAVLGYGIKPDSESLRIMNLGQVIQ